MRFVQSSNHRHAKFSARLLAYSKEKQVLCEQAVDVRMIYMLLHCID